MEQLAYVKAKYQYEYQSHSGEPRRMQPGDQFILIKKSNEDWWYVQQKGDPKGVYLPATYLEEIVNSNREGISNPKERMSSFGNNRASLRSPIQVNSFENVIDSMSKMKTEEEPTYMNYRRSNSTEDNENCHTDNKNRTIFNSKTVSIYDDEMYRTNSFIPRFPVDSSSQPSKSFSTFHPSGTSPAKVRPAASPEYSAPAIGLLNDQTLPPGWQKGQDDAGLPYYTHENSTERWRMNKDENGRSYYYNENGHSSKWELPDLSHVNLPSRRLSENLDDLGPRRTRSKRASGDRSLKAKSVYVQRDSRRSKTLPGGIPENEFVSISAPFPAKLPTSFSAYDIDRRVEEDSPPTLADKTGHLYCLRLKDHRKTRNKWSKVYVVLTHSSIVIYKDQQMFEGRGGSLGRPESSIELNEATVKVAEKDFRPKGKNAFHLISNTGVEMVLHSDKSQETDAWYETIIEKISKLSPPGHRPDRKGKHSVSDEDNDIPTLNPRASRKQNTDKKKIRSKLLPFIVRRPTKRDLEIKGILKEENVFGKRLDKLCEKEGTVVPKFVEICIATIDKKGLSVDGIYRVSANLSMVQKLRCEVDLEREVNLDKPPWDDIHVLTGALKLFFRELPDPLIPSNMYQRYMSALKAPDRQAKIKMFRELVKRLPSCNYSTLKMLLQHLLRVAQRAEENRMQEHNLAIVFGPTLMWPQEETGSVALNLVYQNQVIEFLLLEMKNIF
ncbi:rho GTPase-activating protein 15-like [Anneissia japonica]|uniref:rho GTPase-activating protein 15-like n=1 Tax=Anneissia japonica TaxID=1529436 RepID=UPI0014255B91|nr:rho GTPase-activating protein 15-like [Anneissia japonica]